MRYYIALIHKDADSDFGVSFPDLPGCITAGRTLDEARVIAAEASALHLEGMIADGEIIPGPSSIEAIMANPAIRDGVVTAVPALPLSEGRGSRQRHAAGNPACRDQSTGRSSRAHTFGALGRRCEARHCKRRGNAERG
jgi:predicted RNase H-like HicB family nuclease